MGQEDAVGLSGGQTLFFEWKFPKGDGGRLEGSVSFTLTRSKDAPVAKVLDTKAGGEKKKEKGKPGAKAASTLSAALLKGDLASGELIPGLKLKVDASALEAKMQPDADKAGESKIDFDFLKLNLTLEGNVVAPDAKAATGGNDLLGLLSEEFSDYLAQGYTIKVAGKGTIKIDPSDAARLKRYAETTRAMARNLDEAVALGEEMGDVQRKIKRIEATMDTAQRKGRKLANKKELDEALRKLRARKKSLATDIAKNNAAFEALEKTAESAVKGLKSKEGKLMAEAVKRGGKKALARLIPIVNVVSTAQDLIHAAKLIYHLAQGGEIGVGLSDGPEGELGAKASALDVSELTEEEAAALIAATEDMPEEEEEEGEAEEKVQLHSTTAALLAALKKKGGGKTKLSVEDIRDLNDAIPRDISSEELDALLRAIGTGKVSGKGDVYDLIGQLRGTLDGHRAAQEGTAAEPVLVEAGERPSEPAPIVPPPPLNPRAQAFLKAVQDAAGVKFTPEELERLNTLIPATLDDATLAALIARARQTDGVLMTSGPEALAAIEAAVEEVQGKPVEESGAEAEGGEAPIPVVAPSSKDITDPAKLAAHQSALEAAVGHMKSTGWKEIAVLASEVDLGKVKESEVFDCYYAGGANDRYAGGMTKVVVISVDTAKSKVRIRRHSANMYTADGKFLGTLPAQEKEMSFK